MDLTNKTEEEGTWENPKHSLRYDCKDNDNHIIIPQDKSGKIEGGPAEGHIEVGGSLQSEGRLVISIQDLDRALSKTGLYIGGRQD